MAYGFSATNDSGQLLITDNMENLHFVSKLTSSSNDGGGYGDFPEYGGVGGLSSAYDALDGRTIFTYTLSHAGTPIAFIKPADYSRWHAILTQSESGGTWTFDVIVSGTSTSNAPTLYCFVNANNSTGTTSDYGLIVYKSNGSTRTFDSRYSPLAVSDGGTIISPSDPTDSSGTPGDSSGHAWNYATLDHDFRSTTRYNSESISGTYTDLMFSAPSLAQAVYKREMNGYKRSCGCCGFGCQDHYSTAFWWVFYRNTFRLRSGNFDAGWTNLKAGFSFSSNYEGGGWFGGGAGGTAGPPMPYTAKTINLTSNAFMIADSTRYD